MLRDFIKEVKGFSELIKVESLNSWKCIDKSQSEPDIIRDYLTMSGVGVDYLNNKIARVITEKTNYEMKFASIFCHQKPRVERTEDNIKNCKGDNKTEKCELGDLAIIFLLLDKNKKVQFSNALILQAKKGAKINNKTQQCLYENDDSFLFPKYFEQRKCQLPKYEENRTKALAYLFINPCDVSVCQIPEKFKLIFSWSFIFQKILTNDFGKEFKFSEKNFLNDWDKLISSLIIKLSDTNNIRGNRRVNGLDILLNRFNYYYYYAEYKLEVKNEGIPTIMIIVRNKKE